MKINGSLLFDASSASEIQNLRIEKVTNGTLPAWTSADQGRLVWNTDTGAILVGTSSAWVSLATGGNAAAIQTEVDAIETSLGGMILSDGTFDNTALTGSVFSSPASVTAALNQLAAFATGKDQLSELTDVDMVNTLAEGQFLRYNFTTSKWENELITAADIDGVTVTAAQINNAAATTATTTELDYVDGVTSGIQGQLDGKQAADAGLTALASFNTNGILVQTADNTFAGRSVTAPAAGVTVTNGDGVVGNIAIGLANDLAAVEALATNGYAVRTGTDTWATRTIAGTIGNIVVTNGDGIASNTDIDLATVTDPGTSGSFLKFVTDNFGRVVNTVAVAQADITGLVDSVYVKLSGSTMASAANLTFTGGGTATGLPTPANDSDAANKAYVDAIANGLTWKNAVHVLSDVNIDIASPVSATIGGQALSNGDRVLLIAQTTDSENGIYIFNGVGVAMVRTADASTYQELNGAAVFVQVGTFADSGWTQTSTLTAFTGQVWSQFSGGSLYTWGTGLAISGNTISVNLGSGIFEQGLDAVGIELHDAATGAIILTEDGTTRSTANASKLFLLLDAAGGLAQAAGGLKINTASVSNAMLTNSGVTLNADSGSPSTLSLGDTFIINGTAAQGVYTAVSGDTITITANDATTVSKGVASFDAADFDVTAGVVTIKAAGVDNAQLANSSITVTGTTGSKATALGASLAIVGGAGGEVSTASTTGQVAISVRDATTSLKGVASFAAADFTVTAGDVTLVAKGLDSLTDATISSASAGQTLVYSTAASAFVNRKVFHTEAVASSTTWTITHNLGQKFCNVTVADNADQVVIPQSITFDSATQLTITFNTALAGQVMVSGVNPA